MSRLKYPREALRDDPGFRNLPEAASSAYLDIIDAVFFASTLVEEGEHVPLSVVVDLGGLEDEVDGDPMIPNDQRGVAWSVTRFNPAVELTPKQLKKLARATEYGRDQIVVGPQADKLVISGIARRNRSSDGGHALRVAAPRSGVLVLEGLNRFLLHYEAGELTRNVFDVVWNEGPVRSSLEACHADLSSVAELLRLARATGCGAMFLFLRSADDRPVSSESDYRLAKTDIISSALKMMPSIFEKVAVSIPADDDEATSEQREREREVDWEEEQAKDAIARGLEQVARLSAVDGAVVINPGFEIIRAAYIVPTGVESTPPVAKATTIDASGTSKFEGGGARHTAGIQFAAQHPGAVVFVVSADGPVTCITKLPSGVTAWSVHVAET